MTCIGWDRKLDPVLHDFYAECLLEPGWTAGELTEGEAAYIARELTRRPALRRLWEVRKFTRQRKTITPAIAERLCQWWAERLVVEGNGHSSDTVAQGSCPSSTNPSLPRTARGNNEKSSY